MSGQGHLVAACPLGDSSFISGGLLGVLLAGGVLGTDYPDVKTYIGLGVGNIVGAKT